MITAACVAKTCLSIPVSLNSGCADCGAVSWAELDFPAEIARALPRSFEKRLSSDYSEFVEIGADEVDRVKSEVHAFIDRRAGIGAG